MQTFLFSVHTNSLSDDLPNRPCTSKTRLFIHVQFLAVQRPNAGNEKGAQSLDLQAEVLSIHVLILFKPDLYLI